MRTLPPHVGDRSASPPPDGQITPHRHQDADQSNATRYLCVGAQIDSGFAARVIREILEQRYRAIAPSYGLDVRPIVIHALNGRSRRKRRDLLLILLAVFNLIANPVITTVTALSWLWIRFVYRIARQQRPFWHPRYALYLATVASVIVVPILALTALLLSMVVGLLRRYVENIPVIISWPVELVRLPSPITASFIVLSLGLAWLILCWYRLTTRRVLVDTLRPHAFRSGRLPFLYGYHPRIRDRFAFLQEAQPCSNVTVYSGYSPFLGSGDEVQTWGFTVDLSRGARRPDGKVGKPKPFTVTKLHRHVRCRLDALRDPSLPPAERISDFVIEDRLFVSGGGVQGDRRFLPQQGVPPVARVSPRVIHEKMNRPTGSVRHFKCLRVDSWMREIAFSEFLHFAIHGRTLHVEQTVCRLLPIRESYHMVDGLTRSLLPGEKAALAWETLKDLPASLLRAPVELFSYWRSRYRETQQDRVLQKMLHEQLPIDCGARVSVRELGQASDWGDYFQELDWYRQLQVIQSHILNAILDFLETHHIDTSEFRERQSAILNFGVFMPGGSIHDSTIAAGPGASAVAGAGRPGATEAGPAQNSPKGKP
jgi:hypothetical protein